MNHSQNQLNTLYAVSDFEPWFLKMRLKGWDSRPYVAIAIGRHIATSSHREPIKLPYDFQIIRLLERKPAGMVSTYEARATTVKACVPVATKSIKLI